MNKWKHEIVTLMGLWQLENIFKTYSRTIILSASPMGGGSRHSGVPFLPLLSVLNMYLKRFTNQRFRRENSPTGHPCWSCKNSATNQCTSKITSNVAFKGLLQIQSIKKEQLVFLLQSSPDWGMQINYLLNETLFPFSKLLFSTYIS